MTMPVQLNEPLNTLQRLCEELEYSELLDRAAITQDPFERMVRWKIHSLSVWAESFVFLRSYVHFSAVNGSPLTEADAVGEARAASSAKALRFVKTETFFLSGFHHSFLYIPDEGEPSSS